MANMFISLAAFSGMLAVAFGAFGAHALKSRLDDYALGVFETAVQYHFIHSLALLAVGMLALSQPQAALLRSAGWLLIVVAIALDIWAFLTFRKHSANMMPHKAATHLLTSGPFAHSRNPIYLANVLIVAGIGFAIGSRWFILGAVVLFFLLSELVIKREESHLETKFGQSWLDYKNLVRRWI